MARTYNPARNLPPPKPKAPAGQTKSTRNNRRPWSRDDMKELKLMVKQNTPTRVMGLKLGRTEAAVRAKAREQGLSLMPPNRSPYSRRRT